MKTLLSPGCLDPRMTAEDGDPRLAMLVDGIVRLSRGDLSSRMTPSAARDDVDAVITTGPTQIHADQAEKAMRAGKHVLIEKPMCLNLREAEEIIEEEQDR